MNKNVHCTFILEGVFAEDGVPQPAHGSLAGPPVHGPPVSLWPVRAQVPLPPAWGSSGLLNLCPGHRTNCHSQTAIHDPQGLPTPQLHTHVSASAHPSLLLSHDSLQGLLLAPLQVTSIVFCPVAFGCMIRANVRRESLTCRGGTIQSACWEVRERPRAPVSRGAAAVRPLCPSCESGLCRTPPPNTCLRLQTPALP